MRATKKNLHQFPEKIKNFGPIFEKVILANEKNKQNENIG